MTDSLTIKPELLDALLSGGGADGRLLGDGGLFRQLKKALLERALDAELTHHLGYEKGVAQPPRARGNSRNGRTAKTVLTEDGEIGLSIPRDRVGTFEPRLVPKGVTRVKVRDEGLVKNKAVYVALAFDTDGQKHVLGLWIERTEGARFWLRVMNELKSRGLNDILIAAVDGLKGFPEAIAAVYPETIVQTCIVHLIRHSLAFVSWQDRKTLVPDLKAIYRADNPDAALERLDGFEAKWGKRYPAIAPAWRRAWDYVVPLFAFPPAIRKLIYTTNAVESLNRSLRKTIKTRGSFPTDDAALKLLYLSLRNAGLRWRRPVEWTAAISQFAILFPNRFVPSAH